MALQDKAVTSVESCTAHARTSRASGPFSLERNLSHKLFIVLLQEDPTVTHDISAEITASQMQGRRYVPYSMEPIDPPCPLTFNHITTTKSEVSIFVQPQLANTGNINRVHLEYLRKDSQVHSQGFIKDNKSP